MDTRNRCASVAPPASSAVDAVVVVLAGAFFGFGLAWSGMVRPEVVLGFLQFQDWGLMLVMAGGMGVAMLAYQLVPRAMPRPVLASGFEPHTARMHRDTFVGAALFGIGWGTSGVCPGPAIAGLGTGNLDLLWTLVGLAAGAGLHGVWAGRRGRAEAPQMG